MIKLFITKCFKSYSNYFLFIHEITFFLLQKQNVISYLNFLSTPNLKKYLNSEKKYFTLVLKLQRTLNENQLK